MAASMRPLRFWLHSDLATDSFASSSPHFDRDWAGHLLLLLVLPLLLLLLVLFFFRFFGHQRRVATVPRGKESSQPPYVFGPSAREAVLCTSHVLC